MNKVFIGGYSGSGTRVVSMILQKAGYNIGENNMNETYDYMPVLKHIDDCWNGQECFLNVDEKEPYAIKHGALMLVIPELKITNPGSKFILVMRHGVDNILNGFEWENIYFKNLVTSQDKLIRKIHAWTESYKIALKDADHVIKLEDLCFYSEKTIQKLFDFLKIDKDPKEFTSIIKVPMTIGRRKELAKDTQIDLFNIGREVLNKFNYVF